MNPAAVQPSKEGPPRPSSAATIRKLHDEVLAQQAKDILTVLLILRFLNSLCVRTFFQADEYFQALEPAWNIAFGPASGAWLTWVLFPAWPSHKACAVMTDTPVPLGVGASAAVLAASGPLRRCVHRSGEYHEGYALRRPASCHRPCRAARGVPGHLCFPWRLLHLEAGQETLRSGEQCSCGGGTNKLSFLTPPPPPGSGGLSANLYLFGILVMDDHPEPLAVVLLDPDVLQLPGDYADRYGSLLLAVGASWRLQREVREGVNRREQRPRVRTPHDGYSPGRCELTPALC